MNLDEKIKTNTWENNLPEVMRFILESARFNSNWEWYKNTKCKYVQLRIDMRDGGFIILDKDGNRISFDNLKYQYKDK